jgi:phosphoserine phosphatase
MKQYGATYETTATIGDTASDAIITKLASLSIAYNSDDSSLLDKCKYHINKGKMLQVIELLDAYD